MPNPSNASRLLALAGSFALTACAQPSIAPNEAASMPTPAAPHAAPDAATLLKSLLALIGQSRALQDITPERVRAATGLATEAWGETRFGFRGSLTPRWNFVGDVDVARQLAPGMEFRFLPSENDAHPDVAEICAFDFTAFANGLREAGFAGGPHFGEHGQVLWHEYRRDALLVQVMGEGAMTATSAQACVTSVVVR